MSLPTLAYIYALADPDTKEVRYVGKSNNPSERLAVHLLATRFSKYSSNPHKVNWLRNLESKGISPELIILEAVTVSDWQEREIWWIAHLRKQGCRLTNATDGGEGGIPSEEVRARMRLAQLGRRHTAETKKKISENQKGKVISPETRVKLSVAHKGRKPPPKTLDGTARTIAALTGRKRSAEELRRDKEGAQKRRERAGITLPVIVTVGCAHCGKKFEKPYKHLGKSKHGRHFCCPEHVYAYTRAHPEVIRSPDPGAWVSVPCAYCRSVILKRRCNMKYSKSGLYFCNAEHRNAYRREYGLPNRRAASEVDGDHLIQ